MCNEWRKNQNFIEWIKCSVWFQHWLAVSFVGLFLLFKTEGIFQTLKSAWLAFSLCSFLWKMLISWMLELIDRPWFGCFSSKGWVGTRLWRSHLRFSSDLSIYKTLTLGPGIHPSGSDLIIWPPLKLSKQRQEDQGRMLGDNGSCLFCVPS